MYEEGYNITIDKRCSATENAGNIEKECGCSAADSNIYK